MGQPDRPLAMRSRIEQAHVSKHVKKDVSFALRRATIAQVTKRALDAAQRAAEEELAVNEVGLAYLLLLPASLTKISQPSTAISVGTTGRPV